MTPNLRVNLAPNEVIPFDSPYLKFPLLVSSKFDGMRCLVYDGVMYSRNGKPLKKLLQERFGEICAFSKKEKLVLDGELYSHDVENFGQVMSLLTDRDKPVPEHVKFFAFDCVTKLDWDLETSSAFSERYELLKRDVQPIAPSTGVVIVPQELVTSPHKLAEFVEYHISTGYEGAIARHVRALYKHGRNTLREGAMFKFKEWLTVDAKIVGFEQATQMKQDVKDGPRTKNELGYLERTSRADTRELVEAIGSVNVMLPSGVVCGAGFAKGVDLGITWANRMNFIGTVVEIRYMGYGVKDKPRFAGITRLRPDK